MARPIDETKRTEIATAALAVLRERGVQHTRMSHIAAALGMKRPTLYWYFGSIAELFEYAVERFRADEAAFVGARIAAAGHPIDALYAVVRGSLDFYRERGLEEVVFLLCQGWVSGDQEQRQRFQERALRYTAPSRTMLIGLLDAGQAAGLVKPCTSTQVVDLALVTLNGAVTAEVLLGLPVSEGSLAHLRDHVLEPLRA